jgi:hypothetical protein
MKSRLIVAIAFVIAAALTASVASGSEWVTFRAHGVSVRHPPSWHATARQLTPVDDPPQVLALASYRLPTDYTGANGCQPKEALERMPPTGAFIFGWEYSQPSARGIRVRDFPPRPKRFRLTGFSRYECVGPSYMLRFREAGRFFQVHVFLGPKVGPAKRATVVRILDSFKARRA